MVISNTRQQNRDQPSCRQCGKLLVPTPTVQASPLRRASSAPFLYSPLCPCSTPWQALVETVSFRPLLRSSPPSEKPSPNAVSYRLASSTFCSLPHWAFLCGLVACYLPVSHCTPHCPPSPSDCEPLLGAGPRSLLHPSQLEKFLEHPGCFFII